MVELAMRACTRGDIDRMIELAVAAESVDRLGSAVNREALEAQFDLPGIDLTACIWVMETEDPERLAATVSVVPLPSPEGEIVQIGVETRPGWRTPEFEGALYRFADAQVAAVRTRPDRACSVHSGLRAIQMDRAPILAGLGYAPVRWFVVLERQLDGPITPGAPPAGLRVEAVDPVAEAEALHLTLQEAFLDHWSPVEFSVEQARHMFGSPSMSRSSFLLARAEDGSPAGLCAVRVKVEKNDQHGTLEGDVMMLGVRRPWRGLGLGRHLLLAGLEWMKREGMTVSTLDVDADNPTGAFRLYESVGFTERRRSVTYAREIAAGTA